VSGLPDESAIRDALRDVDDPEAGMNIVDLGLVYAIDVGDAGVRVEMTMTTPACPVADVLTDRVRSTIEAMVPPGTAVNVELVWDPIWNPSMMSGIAKDHFGWA
jgi:metal-sulfur cluster biosynthetic enzyme